MNNFSELFILAMMAIVFTQSGLNKIIDWKGNLEYFSSVFEKVPFMAKQSKFLLMTITCMETLTGLLSIISIFMILIYDNFDLALLSTCLAGLSLLSLLFGQRIAKDYSGAFVIVIYLMPVFYLLHLLQD